MAFLKQPFPSGRQGLMDDAGYDIEDESNDCNFCKNQILVNENGTVWSECSKKVCEFDYDE